MATKRSNQQSKTGTRSTSPATSRSDTSNSEFQTSRAVVFLILHRPGSKASDSGEPQKPQIDFQFLNFTHPSDAKGSRARRTVRSHVTRQQHQKEHAAAAARRAKSFPQADAEPDALPTQLTHAATFPPERPTTLEIPSRAATTTSSTEASSQSPSPTGSVSPMYQPERRINPSDVYPEEWHPYLPRIMVRHSMCSNS